MKKSEAEDLHAWDQYQHSKLGNNVEERIKLFDLESYTCIDKTLLDTGANNGKFTASLAHLFQSATAVEPFAEPVAQPVNVTWVKKGFNDFCESNTQRFDVVYSFAMTIQVADIDLMDTDTIAKEYYNLTAGDFSNIACFGRSGNHKVRQSRSQMQGSQVVQAPKAR